MSVARWPNFNALEYIFIDSDLIITKEIKNKNKNMEIMSLSAITFITMKDLLFFCSGDTYSFVTFGSFLFYCLAEQKSPDQNHPAVFP